VVEKVWLWNFILVALGTSAKVISIDRFYHTVLNLDYYRV